MYLNRALKLRWKYKPVDAHAFSADKYVGFASISRTNLMYSQLSWNQFIEDMVV
jgi:hypothetical protein